METKKYPGYWTGYKRIGGEDSPEHQDFLQIDQSHVYGIEDETVYQIVPHKEMWNKKGKFIGQNNLTVLYEESEHNVAFNYAEDNDLESYCDRKGLVLLTIEWRKGTEWRNESSLGDEEFETPEQLEAWLKAKGISYIIAESTIIADLSDYAKILERKVISMPVCKSKKNDKIVCFLSPEQMTDEFVKEYEDGNIWGVYYLKNRIVYETRDGNIVEL